MATIPYMPIYWGDYLGDTRHLNTLAHGAYLLLIATYWQTGKPLPNDDKELAQICLLSSKKFSRLKPVLEKFFSINEKNWTHKRIEKELAGLRERSELARVKGLKSGEVRRNKKGAAVEPQLNRSSVSVEPDFNYTSTSTSEAKEININTREVSSNTTVIKTQAEATGFAPAEVVPFPDRAASDERAALLLCLETIFSRFVSSPHNHTKLISLLNAWQDANVVPDDIHAAVNEIRTRDPTKQITSPLYFEKIVIEFAYARSTEGNYESCIRGNTRKLSVDDLVDQWRAKRNRESQQI